MYTLFRNERIHFLKVCMFIKCSIQNQIQLVQNLHILNFVIYNPMKILKLVNELIDATQSKMEIVRIEECEYF